MTKRMMGAGIICAVMLTTGCAGFRAQELPPVDTKDLNSTSGTKTRVYSRWSVETDSSMANDAMKAAGAAVHKKYFEDAIKASSCCVLVESLNEANVVVDGKFINENNAAAMIPAVITGLSLFTIPSWVTSNVHISVQAKGTQSSKSYDLHDSMTMVQWLPMIFVLPFTGSPITSEQEMFDNAYKTLVVKMRKDGLLY